MVELSLRDNSSLHIHVWRKNNKWRQEWINKKSNSSKILQAAIGRGKRLLISFPEKKDFPLSPLYYWCPEKFHEFLQVPEIDTRIKSYQFTEKHPCLVIGAKSKRSSRPQLWLHNEYFFPLRIIDSRGLKCDWSEYAEVGNYALPHRLRLEFSRGKILEFNICWRGINSELPDHLFDLQKFREKFSRAYVPEAKAPNDTIEYLNSKLPRADKK